MTNNSGKRPITVSTIFIATSLAWAAQAEIYRTTDKQGDPVFTDQPSSQQQAERVEIQPTNTAPPPENIPALKKKEVAKEAAPADTPDPTNITKNGSPTDTSLPEDGTIEDGKADSRQNNQDNLIKEAAKTYYDKSGSDGQPSQQQQKVDYKLKHLPEAHRNQITDAAKKGAPKQSN